jgi:type II secretory pathway pseudopilin PulG
MKTRHFKSGTKVDFHAAAFTLLEITVAIAVFGFVMISVVGCWRSIITGTRIAQEAAAAAQRSRVGMKTVVEALTCGELSAANGRYYSFLNDTSSKFAALSLAARLPGDFPGSGLYGDNVMRRVTFQVEKDAEGSQNLVMEQSPLLAVLDDRNTPYSITLARDVNVFMLEFWSDQNADWETEWDATNQFPPQIRITLGCGHSPQNPDVPYNLICRTVAMASVAH